MKKLVFFISGICFLTSFVYAQAEDLSITTYYPSPYGSYDELMANRVAVGDTNGSGGLDVGDQPTVNGQLYVARSVIYKPQSPLPGSATKGELVYNNSDNKLYLYNGSAWIAMGGDSPSGMIGMFAACPAGWTKFTPLNNRFPRGSNTYGISGSDYQHSHNYRGNVERTTEATQVTGTDGPHDFNKTTVGHQHHYTGTTDLNIGEILPPYFTVIFCKKD